MNGYSKIKVVRTKKSRSIDFSDLFSHPQIQKPITNPNPNPNLDLNFKTQLTEQTNNIKKDTYTTHDSTQEEEHDEDGVGEKSDVILSRNCSISSTKSHRFRGEKQDNTLQCVVKRAFSMRRSSSVSEGYCRIYDQSDPTISSPTDDDHPNTQTRSKKKMRGKILKACKRFLGF